MSDNLMKKVSAFGERLKIEGSEVGRKMTAGLSSVSFKVKELFQGPIQADKIVEEATSEELDEPDWTLNLEICDMINTERVNSVELIRGIKKRIMLKNPRVQYLSLVLLETVVKNCEKAFSEIAAERVLDEMVKLIDDPQTVVNNRNKALVLIAAWGESTGELLYLPVYEETYKSLRSWGIRFPGRLAPIITPARSVSASESDTSLSQHIPLDIPVQSFTPEQSKEAFDVARNSIELLSTVFSSSPQQDALQASVLFEKLKEMSADVGVLQERMNEMSVENTEQEIKQIKHYRNSEKILLVGEGDFSFSACLAKAFESATNMVATSLDSKSSLRKYACPMRNLKLLKDMGCLLLHNVDAHTMNQHPSLIGKRFDRIVFNFPHAGFGESEVHKKRIKLHQKLVRGFFSNARTMLADHGEVHVTHKTTYPYTEWKMVELARHAGLYLVKEEPFSLLDYPGYINKRGSGADVERSFHLGSCSTFKFAKISMLTNILVV